jgi:hypothetical protein
MLLRRLGEYIGAGFIAINGAILPVAAALITKTTPSSWAIAATTVAAALIAATSYFKMQYYPGTAPEQRHSYNRILAFLAAATQLELMALITIFAVTGVPVPNDLYFLLLVLLIGYVQHNHLLQQRFPGEAQRRRGHMLALSVSAYTVGMIGTASFPSLLQFRAFPAEDLAALFLITFGVFFYGTSVHKTRLELERAEAETEGLRELPGLEAD